jgi:hypothetical protein
MALTIRQIGITALATALIGGPFWLPTSTHAQPAPRLGTSQWDPGGGDYRWTYGPSFAWLNTSAAGSPFVGTYGPYWYGSWGYGPFVGCGWMWRTFVDRRGHLIATHARCN